MDPIPPPIYPTYIPPPPRRRTGLIIYSFIVTGLLLLSVLFNLVLFAIAVASGTAEGAFGARTLQLQEEIIDGELSSANKITVIHINGIISSATDGFPLDDGMVGYIQVQLRRAIEDDNVKAIIIRINSPGGEVVASDMIYRAVKEADAIKPVVACIDSVGASGGYYIAVGARHIIATDMTITGSIGVIMQTFSIGEMANKIGLKFHTFKSGRYKDLLNPVREPTAEEVVLVNDMIMQIYDKFVGIVASERDLDLDSLKNGIADGRIVSGEQAREANLIDATGYFDDAVLKAKEYAGIDEAVTVRYLLPFSLRNLFRFMGQADHAKVQVEISPVALKLQAGHFYFLPAYLFE